MNPSNMILCFSGGIDSTIAWYFLGKPKCIYFDCSRYSNTEKETVLALNPNTIISHALDLREFEGDENAYISHRNLLMAGIASNYASTVILAGVKDDKVEDKNPIAFHMISEVLTKTSKSTIKVDSPFWGHTKADIVKWFLSHIPHAEQILKRSVSCYSNVKYCGRCPSCFRKANALWDNGIKMRLESFDMMKYYQKRAKAGAYIPERNDSIIKFYKEYMQWISE